MATVMVRAYDKPVDEVSPPPAKVAFDRLLSGIFIVITLPLSLQALQVPHPDSCGRTGNQGRSDAQAC
jgi:hypothetical protein